MKCYRNITDWPVLAALSERRISWQPCTTGRAKCRVRSHRSRPWRMSLPRSRWLGTGSDVCDPLVGSAGYHKHYTNTQGTISSKGLRRKYYLAPGLRPQRRVQKTNTHEFRKLYPFLSSSLCRQTKLRMWSPTTVHLRTQTNSVPKTLGSRGCFLNSRPWTQFRNLVILNTGHACNPNPI